MAPKLQTATVTKRELVNAINTFENIIITLSKSDDEIVNNLKGMSNDIKKARMLLSVAYKQSLK